MLTVNDIASLPDLGIGVAAGADGLAAEVTWLHVSELSDPTPWLEGGELLLTTGLGVGELASTQREYVRRLAGHGLAGLGFGVGFGFASVPEPLVEAADALGFPVLTVPYETPFVAITKAAYRRIAAQQLDAVTRALQVHEQLAEAHLRGRGLQALLAIVCNHLRCSLALSDENGRVIGERHAGRAVPFDGALELPVAAGDVTATLKAVRPGSAFGDYDLLVLRHGQTALALELARRRAVSAAELRLAGDLLDDLEDERLEDREVARRIAAFGLDPAREYAALVALPTNGAGGEGLRGDVARELDRRSVRYLSTARPDRAAFLVEAPAEDDVLELARSLVRDDADARVGVGRPARGRALGRSLLEARAALATAHANVASYRDLGSLELLLNLPDPALEAFADRVLGPVRGQAVVSSLAALLDSGCRWNEAADRLGVHRHTLRYRMDRLRDRTGRHPDDPAQRMELWLAIRAEEALATRRKPTA
jgi:purine catabolism regulator